MLHSSSVIKLAWKCKTLSRRRRACLVVEDHCTAELLSLSSSQPPDIFQEKKLWCLYNVGFTLSQDSVREREIQSLNAVQDFRRKLCCKYLLFFPFHPELFQYLSVHVIWEVLILPLWVMIIGYYMDMWLWIAEISVLLEEFVDNISILCI